MPQPSFDHDHFAGLMLSAYRAGVADSRLFMVEHGSPTTLLDKAHRFRSLVQAAVVESDRYRLHPSYAEFGRVQITDVGTGTRHLLRSRRAVSIDADVSPDPQYGLFPEPRCSSDASLPSLLAYGFDRRGLNVWVSPTKRRPGSQRLLPAAKLEHVGFWPFEALTPPPGDRPRSAGTFDQGLEDPFSELGNPDVEGGVSEA